MKAVNEDYVCLLTRNTDGYNIEFSLENGCIYVPRNVALSTECGGLMLYKNLKSIVNVPNFCSKEFGKMVCYIPSPWC